MEELIYSIKKEITKNENVNDISDLYLKLNELNYFIYSDYSFYKTYIERVNLRLKLYKEKTSILEVERYIKDNYQFVNFTDELSIDILQGIVYVYSILNYCDINDIIKYNIEGDYQLIERIYIRIILLKEGWNEHSIEKFIKRLYKKRWDFHNISILYFYFKEVIIVNMKNKIKGRPKIHPIVYNIVIKYNRNKNLQNITKKYNIARDLDKLFTKEEIEAVIEGVDCIKLQDKNTLKKKLHILLKYCKIEI